MKRLLTVTSIMVLLLGCTVNWPSDGQVVISIEYLNCPDSKYQTTNRAWFYAPRGTYQVGDTVHFYKK